MKTRTLISLGLAGAAAAGTAWYLLRSDAGKNAAPDAAQVVVLGSARREDVPVIVETNGSVVSLNSVEVRPQTSNLIAKVHIREGQSVKAGDTLFTLDERADRANLDKALAQLARDEALLADLERQWRRSQELQRQNFISQGAVDTAGAQVQAQQAAVLADRAAAGAARVALGYDRIAAPVSGRAGGIAVFAGSLVQPATTALVTITQINPIAIGFSVPESHLQRLLAAQARGPVAVTASVPGVAEPLAGELRFVDNNVDPAVGSVRAKAVFDNPRQLLWPGQYVNVRVQLDTLADAIVIPQAAVITNTAGRQVYVVDAEHKVSLRKIEPVHDIDGLVAVTGLRAGERIVVEGKQNLRPGSRVREAAADGAARGTTGGATEKAPR